MSVDVNPQIGQGNFDTLVTFTNPIISVAINNFELGNCQALQYNPALPGTAHLFPDDYLSQLYSRMKSALILERTMCGMADLSHNAIVTHLAGKPLFALVEWNPSHTQFQTLGFAWIVAWIGTPPLAPGPRSAFAAYAFFPDAWGSPEAEVLAMLGLSRMFHTYSLQSMYGQRYIRNALTARFMSRFGFKDIAVLPDFLMYRSCNGVRLGACVVSRLDHFDFSNYVTSQLVGLDGLDGLDGSG